MKKCWLFCLVMFCFLLLPGEVQAKIYVTKETLTVNQQRINRKTLHFVNGETVRKQDAYCSDKDKNIFTGQKYLMKLDSSYKKKYCMYGNTGKLKRAKCSTIVGHVIEKAIEIGESEQAGTLNGERRKWYWGQMALWVYLSEYGYDAQTSINNNKQFHFKNTNVPPKWKKNKTIKKILREAFNSLDENNGGQVTDPSTVSDDIITVSGVDGSKISLKNVTGEAESITYSSERLSIKNNTNKKITISFDLEKDINVYDSKGNLIQEIIEMGGQTNVEIYLKSARYYESSNFSIHAEYSETIRTAVTSSSSKLYIYSKECVRNGNCTDGQKAQGMIVLERNTGNENANVTHENDKNFTVVMPKLITKVCPSSAKKAGYPSAKESPAKISDGKCAAFSNNGTNSNEKLTANNYEYYGCDEGNTVTIQKDDNAVQISYILVEVAKFSYGNLSPNEVYAGQGFEISGENQLDTKYSDTVTWDYKYYLNNEPYLNGVTEQEARVAINEAIKRMMLETLGSEKKERGLFMVEAQSPNDDKIDNNRPKIQKPLVKVKLDDRKKVASDIDLQDKTLSYTSLLLFPTVYLKIDGSVAYEDPKGLYSDTKTNFYYTPLDRNFSGTSSQDTFDFNISSGFERGLSLTGKFVFKFEGKCEGKIKYGNITYRSVDVNNPFPRKEKISVNWKNWMIQNESEKWNRLKKSYDDEKLEYSVILDRKKMADINNNKDRYDDWKKIGENGISSFVSEKFKDFATERDVCNVGKIDSKCSGN